MAATMLGESFRGKIWYWVEDSYGSGESTTTSPISTSVLDVKTGSGSRTDAKWSINSAIPSHLLAQIHEPVLHLEYVPQLGDTMLADTINRSVSCEKLKSLAFNIDMNECETGDDATHLIVTGAKANTINISCAKNEEYKVTIDYLCKSVATVATATGTEPADLAGEYLRFNYAGEITKTGGYVINNHIAFITKKIDITIDNGLSGYTDHNSEYKSFLTEGQQKVSGNVDVSLDAGGRYHLQDALDNIEFNLTIALGGVGAVEITLENCQWDNVDIDKNSASDAMIGTLPFTSVPASTSIISTV